MVETKIINAPKEGTPITGEPQIVSGMDITPKIHYSSENVAVRIESYCAVIGNGISLAVSSVGMSDKGFIRSHFDEQSGIAIQNRVASRDQLEDLDVLPHAIPSLRILGERKDVVERVLINYDRPAYHLESPGTD